MGFQSTRPLGLRGRVGRIMPHHRRGNSMTLFSRLMRDMLPDTVACRSQRQHRHSESSFAHCGSPGKPLRNSPTDSVRVSPSSPGVWWMSVLCHSGGEGIEGRAPAEELSIATVQECW